MAMAADVSAEAAFGRRTINTITRRLMPLLGLMYLVAYIDRQNVSYAKLQMVGDLGLSETAYGLGASLFFIGYFIFEVPSNVILERVGARRLVRPHHGQLGHRHLASRLHPERHDVLYPALPLGCVPRRASFPACSIALTLWFPQDYRGRMVGWFMIASAIANAIGAAIGGVLLDLDGLMGLRGWQWVFLATGGPPSCLPSWCSSSCRTAGASPLARRGRQGDWLHGVLEAERAGANIIDHANPFRALLDRRVHPAGAAVRRLPALGLRAELLAADRGQGLRGLEHHERLSQHHSLGRGRAGAVVEPAPRRAAPDEQTWHIVIPALLGAACLILSVLVPGNALKFALLCASRRPAFSPASRYSGRLPPTFLKGATAAAGIAAINSVGNLGGFVAQNVVPMIKDCERQRSDADAVPGALPDDCGSAWCSSSSGSWRRAASPRFRRASRRSSTHFPGGHLTSHVLRGQHEKCRSREHPISNAASGTQSNARCPWTPDRTSCVRGSGTY